MRWLPVLAVVGCLGTLGEARAGNDPAGESLQGLPIPAPQDVPDAPERVADRGFLSLAACVYVSGAGDWWTTRQFRQDGVEEGNPMIGSLADSPAGLAAVKLGGGTLINYIAYNLKKDGKRYWKVPQIVWVALNIAVSAHNSNSLR